MRALMLPLLSVCVLAIGIALAVGSVAGTPADSGDRRTVVATTTQVADLVREVGGERVRVRGLLAPNADPHDHEVTPGDVSALGRAAVVVRSGGEVDHWLEDALQAAGGDARVLDLSRHVTLHGDDPHWWQDPRNVVRAVTAIGQALAEADPSRAPAYVAAARRHGRRVRAADAAIAACWRRLPRAQRRLVTTHDAYGYYARRYGLTVVGSVIPSLSTRGQPSARELARLVDAIRAQRIRAIFTERALNARVERAVAREAGATIGRPLWGDTLGPPGSAADSYIGALETDSRTLVDGLAGRRVACGLP
jgi:ABC-type Zn uptake system ZnuABC Zn-binding protein ZnuA